MTGIVCCCYCCCCYCCCCRRWYSPFSLSPALTSSLFFFLHKINNGVRRTISVVAFVVVIVAVNCLHFLPSLVLWDYQTFSALRFATLHGYFVMLRPNCLVLRRVSFACCGGCPLHNKKSSSSVQRSSLSISSFSLLFYRVQLESEDKKREKGKRCQISDVQLLPPFEVLGGRVYT